jgi:hypothetical protein
LGVKNRTELERAAAPKGDAAPRCRACNAAAGHDSGPIERSSVHHEVGRTPPGCGLNYKVVLGLALVVGLVSLSGDPRPTVAVDDGAEGIAGNWRLLSDIDLPPDTPVTVTITWEGGREGISWSSP